MKWYLDITNLTLLIRGAPIYGFLLIFSTNTSVEKPTNADTDIILYAINT